MHQSISQYPPDQKTGVQYICIDEEYAGQRIDNFLLGYLKTIPKSLVYRWLRKGEVRVDGARIKCHYRLQAGQKVRLPPVKIPQKKPVSAPSRHYLDRCVEELAQSVLFEDNKLLVINKPTDWAVHGGSGVSLGVIEALRLWRPKQAYFELIHRLDKGTSGCLLIAKRRSLLRAVHQSLREGDVHKVYRVLVAGHWPTHLEQESAPLLKNTLNSGERHVVVAESGKPALTHFQIEQYLKTGSGHAVTLLKAMPKTGRTHQIRVHCAINGCPILGDEKYQTFATRQHSPDNSVADQQDLFNHAGKDWQKRLWLHCESMTLPVEQFPEYQTFFAPLGEYWSTQLTQLTACNP